MQNLLQKLGEKKFQYISALLCLLGDIILVIYIFIIFDNYEKFKLIFGQSTALMGLPMSQIDPTLIHAQFMIMTNVLKMMLSAFLLLHLFVYLAHTKRKVGATRYIKMTIFITLPTSAWFIWEAWHVNILFSILFALQVPLYIFCYKGINYFHLDRPILKNKEPKKMIDPVQPI